VSSYAVLSLGLYLLGGWCVLVLLEVADGRDAEERGGEPLTPTMRLFWSITWPIVAILFALLAIENWRTAPSKERER
jgi:hypothetical protein